MEQGAVSPLMQDKQPPVLIQVYMADDDGAVREELLARQIDQDTYELLSSPGLAQNLARGDIVSIRDRNAPAEVLKRGGNFCIQIYADYISPEAITALEHDVVRELNGTLDGICEGSLSLAVPAKNGMERINGFFDRFREQTEIQWYYANIYKNLDDDSDETLLYWWLLPTHAQAYAKAKSFVEAIDRRDTPMLKRDFAITDAVADEIYASLHEYFAPGTTIAIAPEETAFDTNGRDRPFIDAYETSSKALGLECVLWANGAPGEAILHLEISQREGELVVYYKYIGY